MLTSLILLMGVGAAWLGSASITRLPLSSGGALLATDAQSLVDARQSLISYASIYPYLYGPAGAGPGHLPCPDTDGFSMFSAQVESGNAQRRDGPNPPCTSWHASAGHLPRHTVLPGQRYLFHAQPRQWLRYQVDGTVINNPTNRLVNVQTLRLKAPASIATISVGSASNNALIGQANLSASALLDTTSATVAAWVIARSVDVRQQHCGSAAPDLAQRKTGVIGSADACKSEPQTAIDQHAYDESCSDQLLMLLVLDRTQAAQDTRCLSDHLDSHTIEGIPATRHWFVRNAWHQWVEIGDPLSCQAANPGVGRCTLQYPLVSRHRVRQADGTIVLQWSVSS